VIQKITLKHGYTISQMCWRHADSHW